MAHGPARLPNGPSPLFPTATPPTLSTTKRCCKSAAPPPTHSSICSIPATWTVRRLLLVDSDQMTKHVVAEVLVDGRWIIVDPAYRIVLRDAKGNTLTREQLTNPVTFAEATGNIPRYDANYTFDHTVHVRMARVRVLGVLFGRFSNRFLPGWEDSTAMTLLVERESYAATIFGILLVIFLLLPRLALRWFGEKRLNLRLLHARYQFQRSLVAFFRP